MSDKKNYLSYPDGFKALAADLNLGTDDPAAKEASLWGKIEMILNS